MEKRDRFLCAPWFFFFFFTLAKIVCCAHTFERRAIEETFSVVMTRQQQQQRDEGDDANIALIQVPIGDSGEHVSIDPRNLSRTNVEDILGVLQSELAPLRVWLECAKAYLAEDNEAAFLEIVGSGCSPGEKASVFSIIIIINSSSFFVVVFVVFDFRRVAIRCRRSRFPNLC